MVSRQNLLAVWHGLITYFHSGYAPTLLSTTTTCDGTSLINCFGADFLADAVILLVKAKCHSIALQSRQVFPSATQLLGDYLIPGRQLSCTAETVSPMGFYAGIFRELYGTGRLTLRFAPKNELFLCDS